MGKETVIPALRKFLEHKDVDAFREVYHHYYQSLCFFAFDYLKDDDQAEDVVQEVFVQVWETPPSVQEPQKLQAYLYAMVRNKCLNQLRSENRFNLYKEAEAMQEEFDEDQSLRVIQAEVYREILESIEKLPARAREVFKLSYLTQLREAEIAERLNISVNSVKTHKKRARSLLKDELKHLFILIMILQI